MNDVGKTAQPKLKEALAMVEPHYPYVFCFRFYGDDGYRWGVAGAKAHSRSEAVKLVAQHISEFSTPRLMWLATREGQVIYPATGPRDYEL